MSSPVPLVQIIESVLREGARDLAHMFHYPHRKFSTTPESVQNYHARLEAMHAKSHYADSDWLYNLIEGIVIESLRDVTSEIGKLPHRRITGAFHDLIENLIRDNRLLFPFPKLDRSLVSNDAYAVPLRRRLMELEPFLVHEERIFDAFAHIASACITGMTKRFLPSTALVDDYDDNADNPDDPMGIALLDIMPDPKGCVQAIVATFLVDAEFDNDPAASLAFANSRQQIALNLFKASRLTPEQARSNPTRLVMPEASDLSPADLVRTYLAGTPFPELLEQRLPFSLTQYKQHHWSIYARTGHGKSQLIQSLILEHLKEDRPPGLIVIDSESDLSEGQGMLAKIARLETFAGKLRDRLVIVDPRDSPPLNMFDVPNMTDETENEVLSLYNYIFQAIDADLTNRQGTAFNFLVRLMFRHPGATLMDLLKLCEEGRDRRQNQAPFRAQESAYWQTIETLDPIAKNFFIQRFFTSDAKQTKEQLAARLYAILSVRAFERMFTAPTNFLNLYDCMEQNKIVLVSTSGLGDTSTVFGRFIMALAIRAAYQRRIDNGNPALLFIDEARPLLDRNVEDILTKTRKYGLFLRFATQHYAQLPDQVRAAANSNTTVKLTGGLSAQDARMFAGDMRTSAEFLSSTTFKDRQYTEFAAFVQNVTSTALKLQIPLGILEKEPRMDDLTYQAMRATLSRKPPPPVVEPASPPRTMESRAKTTTEEFDHTRPSDD